MTEKNRYTEAELQEFKELILQKLAKAQAEFEQLRETIINDGNDASDTARSFNALEEGANTLEKEHAARMAERQRKFIQNLQAALVRIENGTYGICRISGKLIPKERLRAVPHATTTIDAKLAEKK